MRADGFTEEMWKRWAADPVNINVEMNARSSASLLATDKEGNRHYQYHFSFPMPLGDRALITTYYDYGKDEDGWRTFLDSTFLDEKIAEARREEIGTDVEAFMTMNMAQSRPYDGGMEFRFVSKFDMRGLLPLFIKKMISRKMSNWGFLIVDYL